jgi:sulfate transport system permease protein
VTPRRGLVEPAFVRAGLLLVVLLFLGLFLVAPLAVVFSEAFSLGWNAYRAALLDPETRHAAGLSLAVAAIAVPLNLVFGVAAAWAIAAFRFPGRTALLRLIELPLSVSPVVAGLLFVLLFGRTGFLGPWLEARGTHVLFTPFAILLATLFVTLPLVAREVLPVLSARGFEEEEAARLLGARGWTVFRRITLPGIGSGVLYGAVLATARALGEFGAVSVVSGHIRGRTDTLTLHVQVLYDEYATAAAFAVSTLLLVPALAALAAKAYFFRREAS